MCIDLKLIPCFGVAGNFTGHLEQAGEASDFVNVKAEVGAPKAVFPTYLPMGTEINVTPEFLHTFPFDSQKIIFPEGEEKLQIEPECAIICDVEWETCQKGQSKMVSLTPVLFGASNDCSIRKEGAKKISLKKNWGASSKGLSEKLIKIDSFDSKGILNDYRIASFLVRDGIAHDYGEDSAVRDYSYVYEKLILWLLDKFNNQIDEGPAEKINDYLNESGCPSKVMISIGATRYTDFGEHNFLQRGDYSVVVVYPEGKYGHEQILKLAQGDFAAGDDVSVLKQLIK